MPKPPPAKKREKHGFCPTVFRESVAKTTGINE